MNLTVEHRSALRRIRQSGADGLPRGSVQGLVRAGLFAAGLIEERGGRLFVAEKAPAVQEHQPGPESNLR